MQQSIPNENESILGPLPWEKSHLRKCYFRDSQKTQNEIERLPGGRLFNEMKSLRLSLNMFLNAADDLISSINKFKSESSHPDLWYKPNRLFADKIELSIQRGIISSAMCALALVDHSRRFNKKYPVDGYTLKVKEHFHNNERHRFIHSLRRYITHAKFTKANWLIEHSKHGRSVYFFISKKEILEFNGWNSQAKSFIMSHDRGINVEELFKSYCNEVKNFHNWLRVSLFNMYGDIITEYLRYFRTIKGFGVESFWSMMIHQVIPQRDVDPYIYLDQYLSEDEIEDVLSYPFRSKEQVDRIIELLDVYKICDDSLRMDIYRVCRIKET